MRAWALIAVGLLGAFVAVVPALGADQTVTLSGTSFSPATVTINAGEQVTFQNTQGNHDVTFESASIATIPTAQAPWTASRQFTQAGTYGYYCSVHGSPGSGMSGTVVVNAAPPPGTTAPPGTTPPPPGNTTPPPGTTPPPPGGTGTLPATATSPSLAARLLATRACTRRSATCRRPGIRVRVTVQEALVVTGQLQRRAGSGGFRASGRVRFTAPKGISTVRLLRRVDGSRIGRGSYRVTLTGVRSADGTRSPGVVLRFSVRG